MGRLKLKNPLSAFPGGEKLRLAFGVLFFFAFFFLGMTLMAGSTNTALHMYLSDRPHDSFV